MAANDMKKVELEIIALSHSVTQTQNYAVVLGELNGNRRLPIVIGGFEAQAIAVVLERINPHRPLNHDLFKKAMSAFGVDIKEVVINDLVDGIFFSKLICEKDGEIIEIDSRTSDALAMAVRFNCTVSTFEFVMEQAGVILEESEESLKKSTTKKIKSSQSYDRLSSEELQTMLAQVLTDEDYEKAAKIRDELNRRK